MAPAARPTPDPTASMPQRAADSAAVGPEPTGEGGDPGSAWRLGGLALAVAMAAAALAWRRRVALAGRRRGGRAVAAPVPGRAGLGVARPGRDRGLGLGEFLEEEGWASAEPLLHAHDGRWTAVSRPRPGSGRASR